MALHLEQRRLATRGEESDETRLDPGSDGHHRGLRHIRVCQERRLDLTEFHAVAADLHHMVASSDVDVFPVVLQAHNVTSSVRLVPLWRAPPVADRYRGARYQELSLLPDAGFGAVVADCPHAIARGGVTDRNGHAAVGGDLAHLVPGADIRLRRAIPVEKPNARKALP